MRALRITLIVVVVLAGLLVVVDRLAVGFAEDEAADKVRSNENLSETPSISIEGFPFLTQLAAGKLDDVRVGIADYDASADMSSGDGESSGTAGKSDTIHIEDLEARMKGVEFSGDYSSATADSASGTARISYPELLKAAQVEPMDVAPGVQAKVVKLSDGGNGKIKSTIQATVLGQPLPDPIVVTSTMTVKGDVVRVHADTLPKFDGVPVAEGRVRKITDFQQAVTGLPGGIHITDVEAASDGVRITVTGSHVSLVG